MSGSNPIHGRVDGAPYQPGDRVRVVGAVDEMATHAGAVGVVEHLEYACGCGQTFPGDPMIGVRFAGEESLSPLHLPEFWAEELTLAEPR